MAVAGGAQDLYADVDRFLRRKQIATFAIPLAVFGYLVYAHFAFDVSGLIERAEPARAEALLSDLVRYKVHVTKDNRTGHIAASIEGERNSTYRTPPAWADIRDDRALVDLGDGYAAELLPDETLFTVPGYGTMRVTVSRGEGVRLDLPDGPVPDWLSYSEARLDARPGGKRLVVTRSYTEVQRNFWGWSEFFFPVNNPLYGLDFFQVVGLVLWGDRVVPDMSNAAFVVHSFLDNPSWMHGEVYYAVGETILMAFLGTFIATIVALPLAFLTARTFAPGRVTTFSLRRLFDFLRGVDALIWTIVLARAFGPGPMTGTLAIALTDTGTFGKLFSEALENVDQRQIDGVRATGAGPVQRYAFGVIPQVSPVLLSQALYMLESNTRSATIIGAIVGGGIGLLLTQAIATQKDWENVAYYVLLIVIMVILMDMLSGWLRRRLIYGS